MNRARSKRARGEVRVAWVHGFLGSPADVAGVRGDDDVALALPGHAGAPPLAADGPGFAEACARLDAALCAVDADARWCLVGYSMGGRLAMALAAATTAAGRAALGAAPPRATIATVVPISAHPGGDADASARLRLDRARAAALRRDGVDAFAARWLEAPLFDTARASLGIEALLAARSGGDADALAATLVALSPGWQPALAPALAAMAQAEAGCGGGVWPIAGAHDDAYVAVLGALARRCGSPLRVVPDAGHVLLAEAPTAVAAHVAEVVARLAATAAESERA